MLIIVATATITAQDPISSKLYNLKEAIAIQGYDPVAYVENDKAIKGKTTLAVYHQGGSLLFFFCRRQGII